MIVTLELGPEEVTALQNRADAAGSDIETVLHRLIAQLVPIPTPKDDSEDRAERDREMAELKANLDRWRAEQGQTLVY